MKSIKYILAFIIAFACHMGVSAQSITIYKSDNTVLTINYSKIDSIVGYDKKPDRIEFVDLGLSVKWAACNVGASVPEENGYYFSWGETEEKDSYTKENTLTYEKDIDDFSGNAEYDAARAGIGAPARTPTAAEYQELFQNCKCVWTTVNNVSGLMVTGPNGNSIFLPAAGYRYGTSDSDLMQGGYYWGSTPDRQMNGYAYSFCFMEQGVWEDWADRVTGQNIRPVRNK